MQDDTDRALNIKHEKNIWLGFSLVQLLFPFADSWADSPPIPESDLGIGSALGSDPSPDLGLGVGLNLAGAPGLGIDLGPGCQTQFSVFRLLPISRV